MSSYHATTMHPETGEWEDAMWLDDYFGRHRYGVRFSDGRVFDPRTIKIVTANPDPEAAEFERRSCLTKRRYRTEPPLPNASFRAYPCDFCGGWHLATKANRS